MKLAQLFSEAGLPDGVFNVVMGDGKVGAWLTGHPDIANVSFTGRSERAKVMAAAASSLKGVTMELGGKSPLIVFDDADIDNAVSGAMLGNFYTQGEVCTNGTRVLSMSRFILVLLKNCSRVPKPILWWAILCHLRLTLAR